MSKLEIVDVPIEDLIPYANNARTHSDEQVAQIAASIKEFGWTNPILTDGKNGIIAGHGRLAAARKLKMDSVPTIQLDGLNEAKKKALILADNKLALNSGWDNELVAIELESLQELEFDISLTGFDVNFLEEMQTAQIADLGLLPEDKLDNFLNGDTKILRLAYDDQQFETIVSLLQDLQQSTGVDDFSTIIFDLVVNSCKK